MVGTQKKQHRYSQRPLSKGFVSALVMCAGLALPVAGQAQETIAMVDTGAIASVSPVSATMNTSAGTEQTADSQVPVAVEPNKSPITGLEPGTLALIGFGLLALAATRRNAR